MSYAEFGFWLSFFATVGAYAAGAMPLAVVGLITLAAAGAAMVVEGL